MITTLLCDFIAIPTKRLQIPERIRNLTLMKRLITLLIIIACVAVTGLHAQETSPSPGPDLSSPRTTMFTFLDAVNAVKDGDDTRINAAVSCLDLSALDVSPASDEARRATRDLWASLNRIRRVERSELPGRSELSADQTRYTYFPRPFQPDDEAILEQVDVGDLDISFTRSGDGKWRFSAGTVAGIAELNRRLSSLPRQVDVDEALLDLPAWVQEKLPDRLRAGQWLGLRYWQWLLLLLIIFLGIAVDQALRLVARPALGTAARRFHPGIEADVVAGAARGLGLFAGALVWLALVRLMSLEGNTRDVARAATGVYTVLTGTLFGLRLTDLVSEILVHLSERTHTKFDDIVVPLLRKSAKVFIVALGVIYGAQNLSINIVPLITGLGIGGLAFAFAAKDTIENFFGSIAVLMDRPFEVGDWVVVGDVEGTVEELGLRSTRIRTFYNSQVTVPNATLVRAQVDNLGRRTYRRWKTYLGVQYDTTPEQLLAFTEGIRELIRTHPHTRKDFYQVWCNDFADFSLNILLYVFFKVPDWATELRERERLFVDIVRLADRLGVQFAFPTQTVHLYKEEHAAHEITHELPRGSHDDEAAKAGLAAAREITGDRSWQKEPPGAVQFDHWLRESERELHDRGGDG